MRRKEKEITDKETIESILHRANVCRLAMCQDNIPYLVPMNFGYRDDTLFFHSAWKGRKIDMLKKNDRVCFEVDIDHELVTGDQACDFSMKFLSIIGYGKASFIEDSEGKRKALDIIMSHYMDAPDAPFRYEEKVLKKTDRSDLNWMVRLITQLLTSPPYCQHT